jgi:hypothetical protein
MRPGARGALPRVMGIMAAALALGTGCGDSPTGTGFPSDTPYIAGRVTSVTVTSDRAVSVRVEANPAELSGSPKAVFRVDDFTLVQLPGNIEADFSAVAMGQWVRVWTTGAVTDSYPAQGTASAVAIDSLTRAPVATAARPR